MEKKKSSTPTLRRRVQIIVRDSRIIFRAIWATLMKVVGLGVRGVYMILVACLWVRWYVAVPEGEVGFSISTKLKDTLWDVASWALGVGAIAGLGIGHGMEAFSGGDFSLGRYALEIVSICSLYGAYLHWWQAQK